MPALSGDGRAKPEVIRPRTSAGRREAPFSLCSSTSRYTRKWDSGPMDPRDFRPLHKDTFHILVALADRDRHGYSILQDIAARTDGRTKLRPSSLYSAILRMLEDG